MKQMRCFFSHYQFAAETVVTMGKADGKRLVLYGGSHAGFIAIHLITRYPVRTTNKLYTIIYFMTIGFLSGYFSTQSGY